MLRVAHGDNALEKSIVSEWHERFKEGRESVKDDERPRQTKSQRICDNVERLWQLLRSDRRLSVKMMT